MSTMTSDDIKKIYSMQDIIYKCGLGHPNRAGFIRCPFHNEKTASMKIYRDSYYCFGCGENGDIFTFLQKFYGIPFKDAFRMLGGSYEKPTFSSNLAIYKAKKEQEMRKKKEEQLKRKQEHNNMLINIYRDWMNQSEPLSDTWCDCYNALQYQLYVHEILNEKRTGY